MASYRFYEALEIDDLPVGIPAEEAFACGIEWEGFRRRLCGGAPFRMLVITHNAPRLMAMALRQGRFAEAHEHAPGFAIVVVGAGG